jgi:hypothetical protein
VPEKWLPNGVNSRYAYFADNTLAQVVNRSLTTSIMSQHDYQYDVYANRRLQTSTLIGSAVTHAYTFDALDRLLTVKQTAPLDATKDETYTYDPLNNLKTRALGTPVTATTASRCSHRVIVSGEERWRCEVCSDRINFYTSSCPARLGSMSDQLNRDIKIW